MRKPAPIFSKAILEGNQCREREAPNYTAVRHVTSVG
jgi:hypothetical protein